MEGRVESPSQGVEDFLKRHAPSLSIQERKGLESSVHSAVSNYLRDMRQQAEMDRQRQRKLLIDTAPALEATTMISGQSAPPEQESPPLANSQPLPQHRPTRDSTASALTWRSQTPYTSNEHDLKLFRHSQNPRKPPPPPNPSVRRPVSAFGVHTSPRPTPREELSPAEVSLELSPTPPARARPQTARVTRAKPPPRASVTFQRPKSAAAHVRTPRYHHAPPVTYRMNDQNGDSFVREEYVPCLKAWIDGASEYEREVVFNVMKVLQKGKKDGLEGVASQAEVMEPAPFSGYRGPFRFGRRTRAQTPLERYVPASAPPTDSRQYFGGYDDKFRREQQARLAASKDYIHQNSCFTNASPVYRGHFDIHPDWVSEHKINRTLMTKTSRNGLRYGVKQ